MENEKRRYMFWSTAKVETLREMMESGHTIDSAAEELCLTNAQVTSACFRYRIKSTNNRPAREWTPEEIARLGTAPDPAIARILGVYVKTVLDKRHLLGIKAFGSDGFPSASMRGAYYVDLMNEGNLNQSQVARQLGISQVAVGKEVRRYRRAVEQGR